MNVLSRLWHPAAVAALAAACVLPAHAQVHEGDIEMSIVAGAITLEGHALLRASNGYAVFEGDFGDVAGGPFSSDDPGFDSEPGTWASGAVVSYRILGALEFWNGSSWGLAGAERVRLDGNLGEESFFEGTGISGNVTGLIGVAGSNGQVHEHLDMTVSRVGGGLPAVGAYMIQLQVFSNGFADSQPFYIALNRGLAADDFELAVQALAVPEPATWLMLATGIAAVVARRSAAARATRS
jgi:hypothetical protein